MASFPPSEYVPTHDPVGSACDIALACASPSNEPRSTEARSNRRTGDHNTASTH